MKFPKYSLFITIGISIVFTVVLIMSLHSTYSYFAAKNQFLEEMQHNLNASLLSLEKNLIPFIEAYAVNEYENIIQTEIERRGSFAIVVEDDNMGKIMGQPTYITGRIRDSKMDVIHFDPHNSQHVSQLENCFYQDTRQITASSGKKLGKITICMDDKALHQKQNEIIYNTIFNALVIALLHVIAILFILHRYMFRPVSDIIQVIDKSDSDGIPTQPVPAFNSKEMHTFAHSMNHMIQTIKSSRSELQKLNESLETRIHEAIDEIRQKDSIIQEQTKRRALNDLLIDLAHQWRQPLNAAAVAAQNIGDYLDNCQNKDSIHQHINVVVQELTDLSKTISQFTNVYSRKTSDPISIQEGLKLIQSLSASTWKAKGVKIQSDVPDDIYLAMEADEWVDFFSAILTNAYESQISRKQGTVHVHIRAEKTPEEHIVTITDDAGGIDPSLLPTKLFDPYTTTHFKSRGKGLGLYTVHNIVTYILKGTITAENTAEGAQFTIRIPHERT